MKRRRALAGIGGLALSLGAAEIAFGASIVGVRVWPAKDYTRVTIESDQPLVAHHFVAEAPTRLVIDIENLELSAALRELVGKVQADDPYIAGVRIGQNQPRVVRLVVDLKQPVAPQQFTLAPVAAYRHRLLFDLYPVAPVDPLAELIREKEEAEREAVQSVQDALGEFIGRVDKAPGGGAVVLGGSTGRAGGNGGIGAGGGNASGMVGSPPATGAAIGGSLSNGEARSAESGLVAGLPNVPGAALPKGAPTPAAPPPNTPPRTTASAASLQDKVNRLVIVAVDAGHGGEDPGASGPGGTHEKDVVLAIALQLRDRIDAKPGMRAFLTRDADFFVPLQERVQKSRRVQADLFVSIHADAFLTPEARGASVFALSEGGASSSAARWMAQRENAADMVGGVNEAAMKDGQVLRAMLEMSTAAQIRDSLRVGNEVLGEIGKLGPLHKGAVEQAGFAVLKAPDVPSILVETAFISNPGEEARLSDAAYQKQLVEAVFTGIERYFARHPPLARNRAA